ncbi:MAG: response regulator, partial [Myxococcales bacterium]|nr:response regulator [Myxococcales bacterium]
MPKPTVLVADADPRTLGIVEVALRKAGFAVMTAANGAQALERIKQAPPHLAVLEARDGIKVCKAIRAHPKLSGMPVVIVAAEKAQGAKAIEAGADDFLAKPILLKDLAHRARMLIERRQQQNDGGGEAALKGSVRDLGLIDLFQNLLADGKSAIVTCEAYGREARVWVKDGQIVDAEFGALQGEGAFWRLMTWESGAYRAEFAPVEREWRIEGGTQAALASAMQRVEEVAASEVPMTSILAVDYGVLAERLADLPDEVNGVLRCFDGKRTLRESLDLSPVDDLSALTVVRKLLADGILKPVESRKQAVSLNQWLASEVTPAPPKSLDQARAAAALVRELAQAESAELQRSREKEDASAAAVAAPAAPAPVKTVPLIHFPSLRGVRRERIRQEAEQARARIGEGKPLRLSHVVELPPRGEGEALGDARRMSPAVGEAAKRYAPDAPVARVTGTRSPISVAPPNIGEGVPIAPVAVATPVPEVPAVQAIEPGTPPPDRVLEKALLETVEKKRRRRWPLYSAVAMAMLVAAWFLRPQPMTERKDTRWLDAKAPPPAKLVQRQPEAPPQVVV